MLNCHVETSEIPRMKNHVYSIVSDHTPNIVVLLYGETVNISNIFTLAPADTEAEYAVESHVYQYLQIDQIHLAF